MSRAATRWQIQWARARGLRVYAETCPQYIALTADDLRGLNMDFEGAKYVSSPPPRDADSQSAIWQGLRDGTFDLFSSDHCPFRFGGPADTCIRQADLNHGCDYTPCEGVEVTGWPVRTLLRGRTVALDGAPAGEPTGTYLPRRTSEAFEGEDARLPPPALRHA